MYYVVAKIQGYTLLDVDMLPLQGEHWQTDQMVSTYLALVASQFSRLGKLVLTLDFMVVGSIFTGLGVKRHLEQDAQFPLSLVSTWQWGKCGERFRNHDLSFPNEYNLFAGSIQ